MRYFKNEKPETVLYTNTKLGRRWNEIFAELKMCHYIRSENHCHNHISWRVKLWSSSLHPASCYFLPL